MSVLSIERTMMTPLPHHEPTEQIAQLRLAALPNAVSCARRFVGHQLSSWRLGNLIDNVTLVVSELTGNSVKFTGPQFVPESYTDLYKTSLATVIVQLRLTSTDLYAEVWDAAKAPPEMNRPDVLAECGRGLIVVAELSDEWGHYPSQIGGKVTWGRFQIKPRQAPRSASTVVRRDGARHLHRADFRTRGASDVLAELNDEQLRRLEGIRLDRRRRKRSG